MKNKIPLIAVCALALIAGIAFSALISKPTDPTGAGANLASSSDDKKALSELQESLKTSIALPLDFKSVPNFSLLNAHGEAIDHSVFSDQWSIVFFGYTHCPDVCPITLQVMKGVVSQLSDANQTLPQVVFVTVDPVRDTPDIMKNYIGYFDDQFVGITGDMQNMHELTRSLGIVASFTANDDDPENYIVDHTASLLLIDPEKRIRAKISPPHEADAIVADYLSVIQAPS